jgi:hypothetical protein
LSRKIHDYGLDRAQFKQLAFHPPSVVAAGHHDASDGTDKNSPLLKER